MEYAKTLPMDVVLYIMSFSKTHHLEGSYKNRNGEFVKQIDVGDVRKKMLSKLAPALPVWVLTEGETIDTEPPYYYVRQLCDKFELISMPFYFDLSNKKDMFREVVIAFDRVGSGFNSPHKMYRIT